MKQLELAIEEPGKAAPAEAAAAPEREQITTPMVRQDVRKLVDLLLADALRGKDGRHVPKAADEFIGMPKVETAEKIRLVTDICWQVVQTPSDAQKKEELNALIALAANSASDPAEAVSLVARIWKYLLDNRDGTHSEKSSKRMGPGDLQFELEFLFRQEHHIAPLSENDRILLSSLRRIDNGDDPDQVCRNIETQRQLVFNQACPRTRGMRQVAKHRGVNRDALFARFMELGKVGEYVWAYAQKTGKVKEGQEPKKG